MKYMLAVAVAALLLGTGTARADPTDDAFVSQLKSHGITLPASVSPFVLGNSLCVHMKRGQSMIDTTNILSQSGFQGMTFSEQDASYVVFAAHAHYCPDTPVTAGTR
jgi:Protein of unknown function (DUF732)